MLRDRRSVERVIGGLVLIGVVGSVAYFLRPIVKGGHGKPARTCMNQIRGLTMALQMYDTEWDRFPAGDQWTDRITPYASKSGVDKVAGCPDAPEGSFGYATNLNVMDKEREGTILPLLFDSTAKLANTADLLASVPKVGRHNGKSLAGYTDGHVSTLKPAEIAAANAPKSPDSKAGVE